MITNRSSRVRAMDETYIEQRDKDALRQAKKRKGLIRRLSVLVIIAIVLGSASFVTIFAQASSLEEKQQEKAALEEQILQLTAEEQRLHQDIKNYNELDFIAEIARRDYYLSKPGETLFKLPELSSN